MDFPYSVGWVNLRGVGPTSRRPHPPEKADTVIGPTKNKVDKVIDPTGKNLVEGPRTTGGRTLEPAKKPAGKPLNL